MSKHCPFLFQNLYVQKHDKNSVKLAFCCIAEKSDPVNIIDFQHAWLAEGRNYFQKTGELPGHCKQCSYIESSGGKSQRLMLLENNVYAKQIKLETLHYNCEPICNLKCITCSHDWSSAWIEDAVALGYRSSYKILKTKNNTVIWELGGANIKSVYFNGGEPLLTQDHINLIKILQNTKQMKLIYNTNATCSISQEVLSLWENFLHIDVFCSLDAIGQQLEYIRFPADSKKVLSNILAYKQLDPEKIKVCLTPNIGVHNVLYFEELLDWSVTHNIPLNYHPTNGTLSIINFPLHLKPYLIDYLSKLQTKFNSVVNLDSLLNMANSISDPDLNWIPYLYRLDKLRHNSWEKSLSKLYDLDQNYFKYRADYRIPTND